MSGAVVVEGATPHAPSATPRSPFRGVTWNFTFFGVLLYILVITSYRLPVGDIAVAMAAGGILLQRGGLRFPPYLGWLSVFAAWAYLASTQSAYPEWVAYYLPNVLKLTVIVLIGANALRTRPQVRLFAAFFLACFVLFPLRGAMFNFLFYGHAMEGRAVWNLLYGNPNDLGAMALLQLSMAVALIAQEPKGWVRLGALLGVLAVSMLILMTQSRGVFLGLLVFIAIAFAGHRRRLGLALRIGVAAAVLAALAPSGVWERIQTLRHATSTSTLSDVDGESGSARQRYEIWQVAFKIIRHHPVTGVGVGAYKPSHEQYALHPEFDPTARGQRDTHSLYFNVLAETGYPGLFLYLGMLAAVLIPAERVRRRCKGVLEGAARQLLLLEAGLVAFLIASLFGSLPYLPHLLFHLVLLYAVTVLHRKDLVALTAAPAMPHPRRLRGQPATEPNGVTGVAGPLVEGGPA